MEFFNAIFRANQAKILKERLGSAERHHKYLSNVYRIQRERMLTLINDLILVLSIEADKPEPRINVDETRAELVATRTRYHRYSSSTEDLLKREAEYIASLKKQIEKLEAPRAFRDPI